jgi:hypothetical protein
VNYPTLETAHTKEATVDVILDTCSDSSVKCATIDTAISKEATVDAILIAVPIFQ